MAKEKQLIYADSAQESVEYLKRHLIVGDSDFLRGYLQGAEVLADGLAKLPPVDVTEVVHAEWLDIRFDSMWKSMLATCSHCKVRGEVRAKSNECGFAVPDSDYCPHCGAKMDGGINK